MKRRAAYFLLLTLAISIPCYVAYSYYDYYGELSFHYRKYFTAADEDNLLTYLKNNPRVFFQPTMSVQQDLIPLLEPAFLQLDSILLPDFTHPVLRC